MIMITHNGWGALFPLLFVQNICMGLSFVHIFIIVFVGNIHYSYSLERSILMIVL